MTTEKHYICKFLYYTLNLMSSCSTFSGTKTHTGTINIISIDHQINGSDIFQSIKYRKPNQWFRVQNNAKSGQLIGRLAILNRLVSIVRTSPLHVWIIILYCIKLRFCRHDLLCNCVKLPCSDMITPNKWWLKSSSKRLL